MKHPRTLIRQAVKDRLVAQLPLVDPRISEARISIHRSTPLFAAKLPAILIYTRDERIEDAPSSHPGIRYRKLELSVEVITSGEEAIEDADTLAQAIETILDADETLGLLVQGTRLTRTEVDHDGDGDTPVLAAGNSRCATSSTGCTLKTATPLLTSTDSCAAVNTPRPGNACPWPSR